MREKLTKAIDYLLEEVLLQENPDTVKGKDGQIIVTVYEGPAIAFYCLEDKTLGKHKWFYYNNPDGTAWHGDIRRQKTPEFPNVWCDTCNDRFLRGRIWTEHKIVSFYSEKNEIMPHKEKVEELFKLLKLNIADFQFEFRNSARTDGLVPWPGSAVKPEAPSLSPEEQAKVDLINKKIAELQATLHLKVGLEKKKVEDEIESLEKAIGKIGGREAAKAAYRQATAAKLAPYEKGAGSVAAARGMLPAIAEMMQEDINNILDKMFLKENPDTVNDENGRYLISCGYGPAVAFKVWKNESGLVKVFYADGRDTSDGTSHGDVRITDRSFETRGTDEVLRGRLWSDLKICSFYQREMTVAPYSQYIVDFFKELGEDIRKYRFDFGDSSESEGLKPWPFKDQYKAPQIPQIPPDIQKKINDLLPQFHLTTGEEKERIKRELDQIYKQLGIENAKEAEKIAYMKMSGEKQAPYEKGAGSMAGYRGRLPAIAEAKVQIYNETLCPDLWDGETLKPEVREALLKIALDFFTDTELQTKVQDVYLLGSGANYNWTPNSDVDVHLLVDGKTLGLESEIAEKFFRSLTGKWNLEHEIEVKGHKVELYVQNVGEENSAMAVYSLVKNQWVKPPTPQHISVDKALIQKKYTMWSNKIEDAIKDHNDVTLKKIMDGLKKYRQAGLDKGGEFSPENLVFKILRSRGYLEKLKDYFNKFYDKKMAVKDAFDPTSVGPNPEASEGETNAAFYQAKINQMQRMEEVGKNHLHSNHPYPAMPQNDDQSPNLSMMNLDNLRSLELKSKRFLAAAKAAHNKGEEEHAIAMVRIFKDEIEKRLGYINRPVVSESHGNNIHSKNFRIEFGTEKYGNEMGLISLGNEEFGNTFILPKGYGPLEGKWLVNRDEGAFRLNFPDWPKGYDNLKDMLKDLEKWLSSRSGDAVNKSTNPRVKMKEIHEKDIQSPHFRIEFGKEPLLKSNGGGKILFGDEWFANAIKMPADWGPYGGKWIINRHTGAWRMKFPEWKKGYHKLEDMLTDLEDWYVKSLHEGVGMGRIEQDRLRIHKQGEPIRRWQIRSKDAPKTPKMPGAVQEVIDEILENVLPWPINEGVFLLESPQVQTLKKNRKTLSDEERTEVMKRGAVWHHGPNGEETPGVWKAVVKGKTWYCCNTHRAIQVKPTLKGAIKAFDFIKTTS